MPDINITVAHKVAVSDTQSIVCDNSDYTVHWTLDDEWSVYDTKTMRTIYMDGTFKDTVFSGAEVELPVCTVPGVVQIGLFAGDIRTSRVAILRALPSVRSAAGAPADPTESVYDQLMEIIKGLGGVDPDDIDKAVADYLAAHPIEETDPTVPEWAKAETKPTYSAEEVGAIAQSDLKAATDAALAQAKASGEFDGPAGPAGPQGPAGAPGKDGASMDITGATVGQIAKITAVDASGVPTAWSPVDMPTGGGNEREWVKIGELTTAEDTTEAMHIKFTKDVNGNLLSLKGVLVIGRALFSDTNRHRCSLVCNDNPYGWNANYFLYEPILRNGQFFTIYSEFLRADGVNSVAFTAFNAGNVKQNGGCASTINAWSPTAVAFVQSPMRGVSLSIFDSGLLAGSKFEFWGVKA